MLRLEFFIAKRLYQGRGSKGGTAPIIRLSVIGVALSLMVMLLAIAITTGFKRNVAEAIYSHTGHISIQKYGEAGVPFEASGALKMEIEAIAGVKAVSPKLQMVAMLKTDSAYKGLMLYGVDSCFDSSFQRRSLEKGVMPQFSNSDTVSNPIVLPEQLARDMNLQIGERVICYFFAEKMRIRAFTLVATVRGVSMTLPIALVPIQTLQKVGKLSADACSSLQISVADASDALTYLDRISHKLASSPNIGNQRLSINTSDELNPVIVDWLAMLDSNVLVLLTLMGLVGAFTMIATLVVLVMEQTQLIGTLKAMGARESSLRKSFLYLAMMLLLKGLFWGNLMAGLLSYIQYKWRLLAILDPEIYFIDYVPIGYDFLAWVLVNLATVLLIMLMLIGPAHIISRIRPAKSIRFE